MRKKQLLSSLVLLMAMGIFFAACTETVQKAYYDAIPENASAIGSIKINRLLENRMPEKNCLLMPDNM